MTDAELRAWVAQLEWEWRLAAARRREAAWDAEHLREQGANECGPGRQGENAPQRACSAPGRAEGL